MFITQNYHGAKADGEGRRALRVLSRQCRCRCGLGGCLSVAMLSLSLLLSLTAVVSTSTTPETGGVAVRWISQALSEALVDFAPTSSHPSECDRHSRLYLEALANSTLWAVQMLDASSLSAGGLLTGDMYQLGHYDQCLAVHVPEEGLRGQHCLATIQYGPLPQAYPDFYSPPNVTFHEPSFTAPVWDKVKFTMDPGVTRRDLFHFALCVPSSCSALDLQESLRHSLDPVLTRSGLRVNISVDPDYCHRPAEEEEPPGHGYIIIRDVIVLFVIVCSLATVYDYFIHGVRDEKLKSPLVEISEKILLSYSISKNMNELLEKGSNPRLDLINGVKVISNAAILFGHRALFSHGLALNNHQYWELRPENHFLDDAIMNGTHLVDIFFLCSGCLAFLGIYKVLEKRKSVNYLQVFFLRWVRYQLGSSTVGEEVGIMNFRASVNRFLLSRLVPPYLLMMAAVGWLLPQLSDGPLWTKRVGLEAQRCRDNWWLNLLFINNYINADSQCLLLSWYLACDMQLFVLSMFAIYILWRWRRLGYILFGVLLALSIAIPFYVTYAGRYYGILRLYASSLLTDPFSNEHFNSVYVKTHNRAGPYIIGILTGFCAVKLTEINYKFSKSTSLLGFIVLFWGGYAHQWYGFWFYQRDRPYNPLENALYAALHRITFSIGVAWIAVVQYTTGYGLFRVLFCQTVYAPLCRLVYCVVLVHPVLQLASASSVRHSEYMTYPKMLWMACGDYMMSHIIALPLYLMVEAPSRNILKLLLEDKRRLTAEKTKPNTNNSTEAKPELSKQVVISRL